MSIRSNSLNEKNPQMDKPNASGDQNPEGPVIIKRYASRKLYDAGAKEYVTLEDIARYIRNGREVQIIDKKTGEDLTRQYLIQIIADFESQGESALPLNVLTDLVRHYQDQAKSMTPAFLSQAFDAFKEQQQKVRDEFVQTIDQKLEAKMDSGFKGFLFKTYRRTSKEEYDLLLNNLIGEIPATVVHAMERFETRSDVVSRWLANKKPEMEEFMLRIILDILDRIDIQDLLAKQMAHFDESKLEQMIRSATDEQLSYIKLLGTLLGLLGGLLIWEPVFMLPAYLSVLGIMMLLDILIFRLRKATRKTEE